MKNWKKGIILAASLAMAAGIMAGCGGEKKAASSEGLKPLKVATNATYVPFEFKSKDGKDYTGYEIDVVRAVAQDMNRKVEFKNVAFDGLIPALQSKEVDMTASGMTATKERADKILFAAPFYATKLAIVTKADSDIHSVEDLLKEKEVAVQFVATDGKGAFRVVDVPDSKVQYFAFGFNKDNKELQQEVNAAIAKLKKDGTLNKLHEKWFNTPAPDMPSTAEEALGIK